MIWKLNEDRPIWVQLKEQLGKQIVDDFVSFCNQKCPGQPTTLSVVDLAELGQTLPAEMKDYVSFMEKETGIPADIISVGPKRDQTIARKSDWWN